MPTTIRWTAPATRLVASDPDRRLRDFGRRVRRRREELGLGSQAYCATLLRVRQATWSEWESGKKWPDMENAIALSRLLRMTLDELVLGRKCH